MKKFKVLYCPIHYVLDSQNTGSEFSWAYEIYKNISKNNNIEPYFVTGGTRGIIDENIYSTNTFLPDKLNLSLPKIFKFYFLFFLKSAQLNKNKKINFIHHVLPFYISHSFNLLPFFTKTPFIIGPVQSPLSIIDTDLSSADARGFEGKRKKLIPTGAIFLSIINPLLASLSIQTLKKAQKIIVINKHTNDILKSQGISAGSIVIIPPGIDTKKIKYVARKGSATINFITVSYLLKRKSVNKIICAFSEIVKTNKDVHLDIIGDGPQKESLQDLAKKLKLEEFITFIGFIDNSQIYEYYEKASIFINMSKSEGFATVCLEAMASGLAIVSTRVGGFNDAITDNYDGYLLDDSNYLTLTKKLLSLIADPEKIKSIGKRARLKAQKKYDWERVIIPQYIKLYNDINSSNIHK